MIELRRSIKFTCFYFSDIENMKPIRELYKKQLEMKYQKRKIVIMSSKKYGKTNELVYRFIE